MGLSLTMNGKRIYPSVGEFINYNKDNYQTDIEVTTKINNTSDMVGSAFVFLGKDFINQDMGHINYEVFMYMPNLKECHNSGQFHTHVLFVHEDAARFFNSAEYDKLVVIPHHDDFWSDEECGRYLADYLDTHPDTLA